MCLLFSARENILNDGEAEIGLRQVCPTDDKIIFEASILSRKVMLFARNSNDDVQENDLMDGHDETQVGLNCK